MPCIILQTEIRKVAADVTGLQNFFWISAFASSCPFFPFQPEVTQCWVYSWYLSSSEFISFLTEWLGGYLGYRESLFSYILFFYLGSLALHKIIHPLSFLLKILNYTTECGILWCYFPPRGDCQLSCPLFCSWAPIYIYMHTYVSIIIYYIIVWYGIVLYIKIKEYEQRIYIFFSVVCASTCNASFFQVKERFC